MRAFFIINILLLSNNNQYNATDNGGFIVGFLKSEECENLFKKNKKNVIKLLTFGKYGHILLAIKAKDC